MNYLAHAALSEDNPLEIAGNLFADFVKGSSILATFPPRFARGIRFHRRVDGFVDDHPTVRTAACVLKPEWGRYASAMLDVAFDHVLANAWDRYFRETLDQFSDRVSRALLAHRTELPDRFSEPLARVAGTGLLVSYRTPEGLARAYARLARSIPMRPDVAGAAPAILSLLTPIEEAFHQVFPEMLVWRAEALERLDRLHPLNDQPLEPPHTVSQP